MLPSEKNMLLTGAATIIAAIVLSGPPLFFVINALYPQPPWTDAATFFAHFHWSQTLPYWFGFVLLTGNALFVLSAQKLPRNSIATTMPLVPVAFTIYGALVSLNYTMQVAYVPQATTVPGDIVALLTMANSGSLAWKLEMFCYAFLGIAKWLIAPGFRGSRLWDWVRWLLIVDAILSIATAVGAAIDAAWLLSPIGLVGYMIWNLIVLANMVLVLVALKNRATL